LGVHIESKLHFDHHAELPITCHQFVCLIRTINIDNLFKLYCAFVRHVIADFNQIKRIKTVQCTQPIKESLHVIKFYNCYYV
jgi:hypothetical protein